MDAAVERGHFCRFPASRCFVSRGRRGTSWHSDVFLNVSKVFCVAGAILSRCFQKMHCSFRGRRSTLETSTLYTPLFTLYSTLYTINTPHSTLYTPFFTLHTVHSTLYTLHSTRTRHTLLHSTLHTLHSTLHTLHSTLCTPHCALQTLHFTLHTLHSTLYIYTLHSTPYTPHSTLHTPQITLYTPHSTLYTLHSNLHTLHSIFFSIPQSTVHWYGNRGKCTSLFKKMFHKRVLRGCIRVRGLHLVFPISITRNIWNHLDRL